MASQTPNLNLRKPTNQDLVNVATDLASNFDAIDAHVTSASAHSGTYVPLVGNPNTGATKLYLGPALPNSPITQLTVKDDNTPVAATPNLSPFEFQHNGSAAYIFHLTCGPSMGAFAALIGMGIDNDGIGLFVNNKATGTGIKITQNNTISAYDAYGLQIISSSDTAPGLYVYQDATQTAVVLHAYSAAAGQKLLDVRLGTAAGPPPGTRAGAIDATNGYLMWESQLYTQAGTTGTIPMRVVGLAGQTVDLQQWEVSGSGVMAYLNKDGSFVAKTLQAEMAGAYFNLYNTTGTANQRRYQFSDSAGNFLLTARNDANANQRTLLQITHANGNITPTDGANLILGTTTGMKIGTATTQKLGFYNATPIVKPTGVAVDAAGIHAALVSLGLIAA